ncbi:hypothetical protein GGF42_000066 [Coemansia sp. RSA 2424]|nr:hypothetical protein GGF42_000066 [Coemansia sp. RSA 2424]
MNYTYVNTAAAYKASLFFNYFAAICIHERAVSSVYRLTIKTVKGINIPISPMHVIDFALVIAAVAVMFDVVNGNGVDPSVTMIQFVVFNILTMSVIAIVKAVATDMRKPGCNRHALLVSVLPRNLLFILWASFMGARNFLPLDNVTRDSEVAFYMLNIFPLVLAGVAHETVAGLAVVIPAPNGSNAV